MRPDERGPSAERPRGRARRPASPCTRFDARAGREGPDRRPIIRVMRPPTVPRLTVRRTIGRPGRSGNRLIHGDNLAALRALGGSAAGAASLVYIDPPYNTGQRIDHYHDAVAESVWLDRLR